MHLFRRPCGADVQRLLDAAGLPSGDIGTEALEHFFGCGAEHAPQGVAGLEICGDDALLRSLAVDPHARDQGCGRALVAEVEGHAERLGIARIYLLTTTAGGFFAELGYEIAPRDAAPEQIRTTSEFSKLCPAGATLMLKNLASVSGRARGERGA